MMLSNGNDVALVDYHGSMYCGHQGHAHNESVMGSACGWYKALHRTSKAVEPVLQCGYSLTFNDLETEPQDYV